MTTQPPLYQALLDADAAWMDAINVAFPRQRAGDVRYHPDGEGEPGTPLRTAYDAYVAAMNAYEASVTA